MSTGSERLFLFIYLDAIKFALLSFFTLKERFCQKRCSSPLSVEMRRSKTSLLRSSMGKAFLSDVRQPKGICVDATEFVLLCPVFLNKSDY